MQKFILTLGPSLGEQIKVSEIHQDNFIYRINGAHGTKNSISQMIKKLRDLIPDAQILMDLPGNKIRTAIKGDGVELKKDFIFKLRRENFNFEGFLDIAKVGDEVFANDSVFRFEVVKNTGDEIEFLSYSDGILTNGKGMHIRGINQKLPFLFKRDLELIDLAHEFRLNYIGASFVRNENDFLELRNKLSKDIEIFCKVETLSAVENLVEILKYASYILIDRGDLSTEIGLVKIPRFQRYIIEQAHLRGVKVFLATQALKNMESKPVPTIAEIESLYNIFKSGVFGLQLSEETAVGLWIKECISILNNMNKEVESEKILL